ncbi:hypothetical protein [Cellulosimicrobium cellulans]|uniref:hypothetical protein n=1 Tax=Cellulosimicrobium cellulans TaxID=1710 RepID=UPI002405FBB1|nr:hypothetical protein [Cellulosimicrobium cellulans]MDF9876657.1 hypothetical protein [Cellulosimicrobium cellulans]
MSTQRTATGAVRARRLTGATAVLAGVLALTACSPGTGPGERTTDPTRETTMADTPTKNGTGEVRTDLEPLTKRFAALGAPVAATWSSGTVGDEGVPGPTTYWIDAVVRIDPAIAQALAEETAPQETTEAPAVVDDLTGDLPDGPLLAGDALDARFAESGFRTTAYLDVDDATVVLVALGE